MIRRGGRSLLKRTILIVVAAQLISSMVLVAAAFLQERHAHLRAFDVRVQGESDSLLGAIQDAEDPEDNVFVDPRELQLPPEDVYAVYSPTGQLIGSSQAAPADLIGRTGAGFRTVRSAGRLYRVLERGAVRVIDRSESGGVGLSRPVTIVYASPENRIWHAIFEAIRFYLLAILFATALTVLLVALLLRSALSPLAELAAAARGITMPALRFNAPPLVLEIEELRPLASVLAGMADELREAFSREQHFVSDAAHELKTAVAVARSSLQLLMLRPRTTAEYADGFGRVLEDNGRIEALVAQMLLLSSLEESGQGEEESDLEALVLLTLERLQPLAEEGSVQFVWQGTGPIAVRLGSADGLTLLSNLVVNAIQHSNPGSQVSLSTQTRENSTVELLVQDHGDGIAPEALPHVFERFYRADRSRSRATGGTGLGLSICQSIARRAGGAIALESAPGQGTSVRVTFMSA